MAIPSGPVDVLTIDDSDRFLRAAHELISATPGFRPVGEAASGLEGLEAAERLRPDLVLIDVRMPIMDGIETARRLSAARPDDGDPARVGRGGRRPARRRSQLRGRRTRAQAGSAPALLRRLWADHGG